MIFRGKNTSVDAKPEHFNLRTAFQTTKHTPPGLPTFAVKANKQIPITLRGLVCSPREVAEVRQMAPASTQLVIPGIRAQTSPADDQKRTLTAREALALGADWLVIGRPIYAAENPRAAAE
ncbi:MAG: orotidine 5'-phosphate decarboxylase [Verrucomicrobia bacterium]|nr:orotidine 5'-phosphate decarboxylase [Verrucomicrobiota bacterium]